MKKQQIVIGIITILIIVVLSGCTDISSTNISDLQAYPNRYLGEEVKVKGLILADLGSEITMVKDDSGHMFYIKINENKTGWYYVTGNVKYGNL